MQTAPLWSLDTVNEHLLCTRHWATQRQSSKPSHTLWLAASIPSLYKREERPSLVKEMDRVVVEF